MPHRNRADANYRFSTADATLIAINRKPDCAFVAARRSALLRIDLTSHKRAVAQVYVEANRQRASFVINLEAHPVPRQVVRVHA
jgi:hypothetical protein